VAVLNLQVPQQSSLLFGACHKDTVPLLNKLVGQCIVTQSRAVADATRCFIRSYSQPTDRCCSDIRNHFRFNSALPFPWGHSLEKGETSAEQMTGSSMCVRRMLVDSALVCGPCTSGGFVADAGAVLAPRTVVRTPARSCKYS
jgi:hypothetical protein